MRKPLLFVLCLALAMSLAACGGRNDPPSGTQSPETQSQETTPPETNPPETTPPETTPPETTPPETRPPETTPPDTRPPETTPPETTPPETTPPETTPPETTPPETGPGGGGTPGFGGPGFQLGPGGIVTPGSQGGEEAPDVPVADAGDLVDKLEALCADTVEGSFCAGLRNAGEFSNYFGGAVQYAQGQRVALNHLEMAPPAHVVMLLEPPEGQSAEDYARTLEQNANPRWLVCATAESVQAAVKDGLVLFVMSSEEIADAVIAAFNG